MIIESRRHGDPRGWFSETFRDDLFRRHVADIAFVQHNQSVTVAAGTVRGLHFQRAPQAQAKLVRCLAGAIFDVAVDIRPGSSTFGHHVAAELSADNGRQLYIPEGFAHGFQTLGDDVAVAYLVSATYSAEHDAGIDAGDEAIGIAWPLGLQRALMSDKDQRQPPLATLGQGR